jgi:hypothetical protein
LASVLDALGGFALGGVDIGPLVIGSQGWRIMNASSTGVHGARLEVATFSRSEGSRFSS